MAKLRLSMLPRREGRGYLVPMLGYLARVALIIVCTGLPLGGASSCSSSGGDTNEGEYEPYDVNVPDLGGLEGEAAPPQDTVRLVFIHHSTGENWLRDDHGALGIALRDNNYFVSDTNYGWGPSGIGDTTDIGHWWLWFFGPDSAAVLDALFKQSEQSCEYSRLPQNPGGDNEVVMLKSCFPNSALQGKTSDAVPTIGANPLKGESSDSEHHTVANAKGIYIELLKYFKAHTDKLFVVITAPPLQDGTWASNARAFNNWLVNDWLKGYEYGNVFVFDFYNVLTTNGGHRNKSDFGLATGNHHRWTGTAVQHKTDGDNDSSPNVLEYDSDGDDHPNVVGSLKATGEFVPLLNRAYRQWKGLD